MRFRIISKIIGILTLFLGANMLLPVIVGLMYNEKSIILPIFQSMGIAILIGAICYIPFRKKSQDILTKREGMMIVTVGWVFAGLLCALPFYFGGICDNFVDAFFESISGLTTTGSSVLNNVETIPKSLSFWRCYIQWLGGMGIIVLSIAILPFLGVGGMQLYKAEVPSPVPDKLMPRIRDTAKVLWMVYILFSLLEILLLKIGGMNLFDSICHTFTTMPTGGFSTKNASIAYYNSGYIDVIITIFMIIAGINFSLHFQLLRGKPLAFWKDSECRFFLGIVLVFILVVSGNIYFSVYHDIVQSLIQGAFQVASIITTTGFVTANYELWPALPQLILLLSMFIGASAGSTGGGIKCLRVILCLKYCYRELFSLVHPRSVSQIKIGGKTVTEEVIRSILGFVALYILIFCISSLVLAGLGVDFVTSFAAVAACLGNIGPGFGAVGPIDNFSNIPFLGKYLLIFCMLVGRLEIYTVIIFFIPEFWRK